MTITDRLAQSIADYAVAQNRDALTEQFHTNMDDTAIYLDDGRAAIVPGSAMETAVDGWHRRVRVEVAMALEDIRGLLILLGAVVVKVGCLVALMGLGEDQIALTLLFALVFVAATLVLAVSAMRFVPTLMDGSVLRAVRFYRATRQADGAMSSEYVHASLFRSLDVVDALAVDSLTRERRDALYRRDLQG